MKGWRNTVAIVVTIAVVAIGAVLVVVRTRAIEEETAGPGAGTTGTTEPSLDYTRFRPGDCLNWDQTATGSDIPVAVISCDEPHLLEMVSAHTVPAHVTAYLENFRPIFDEVCTADVVAFLGGAIDPDGRFYVTGLQPTRAGWDLGDRQLLCGVGRTAMTADEFERSSDQLLEATGSSVGQPQARLYDEGTCIRREPWAIVACEGPHEWEVTGTFELPGIDAVPPVENGAAWGVLVGDRCDALAVTYLGHAMDPQFYASWIPVESASWAAGRRSVQCTVARRDLAPLDAPVRGVTS